MFGSYDPALLPAGSLVTANIFLRDTQGVVIADADHDGVPDAIDPDGGAGTSPPGAFLDGSVTPATSGAITSTGGLAVTISDAPAPDGVLVTTGPGSGVAVVSSCGLGDVDVAAASSVVVTCGSITAQVVTGSATIVLGGGTVVVAVAAGAAAKVSDLGGGNFSVQNLGGGGVTVTSNGSTSLVGAGQTSSVVTISSLCKLTKQYVQDSAKYLALGEAATRRRHPRERRVPDPHVGDAEAHRQAEGGIGHLVQDGRERPPRSRVADPNPGDDPHGPRQRTLTRPHRVGRSPGRRCATTDRGGRWRCR